MVFALDPDVASALEAILKAADGAPLPARGDWQAMRAMSDSLVRKMAAALGTKDDVVVTHYDTRSEDGSSVPLRWYSRPDSVPGAAVVYIHGGGMISCNLDIYDPIIRRYVAHTGVPMLAAEYRLAPEHPYPAPVADNYAALAWLHEKAEMLQVDPSRIAVMGDSAGGGLAASVALLARDRGQPLSRQILIYPMLDDRNITPDPLLVPFAVWSYDQNYTGWNAFLGKDFGTDNVPPIAVPFRVVDLTGSVPAYIEVGNLDIFRDESIFYAQRLLKAGTPVELHVHPGAPHGFEVIAPQAAPALRAMADRYRNLMQL